MNIIQITPGAGGMYCGNCFRDNALVAELRKLGHQTLMVPLYLPMTLDEEDESRGTPTFFGGVNVYLEQKSPLFRHAPAWLHRWLASPGVLQWAAGRAAKTRAEDLGDITISMLRGEEGNQVRELDELITWLKQQPHPDIICLSNALLAGMARKLKQELRSKIVCMLQGEDYFLDALPVADRERAWKILSDRARVVDLFIAPSRYFAELMARRIDLPAEKVKYVYNGIHLDGYEEARTVPIPQDGTRNPDRPVLGYFARMCREKGLDTLVEAYILLRRRGRIRDLQLRVGGGCGPADEPFVASLKKRLEANGILADAEFHPNLALAAKQEFYRGMTVFSVPALYGEAFGLYVIEALASGVPVVQPRVAAFPELIEATGGGILCEPRDPKALADSIEKLLLDPARIRTLGEAGRQAVRTRFNAEQMTRQIADLYQSLLQRSDRETNVAVGAD